MKRVIFLFILIQMGACENSHDFTNCDSSNPCLNVVIGKPDTLSISDSTMNIVKSLFESNNLNLDNLFINSVTFTKLGSENTHVFCSQYVNNLNVLSNHVIFHFDKQGLYSSISGDLISTINITTSPSMSVCNVIVMFLQSATNDGFVGTKDHTSQIDAGCVTCELGYYDLNAGSGNSTHNFKRAWRIKTNNSSHPYAYINDSDQSLIFYDNGVIIN